MFCWYAESNHTACVWYVCVGDYLPDHLGEGGCYVQYSASHDTCHRGLGLGMWVVLYQYNQIVYTYLNLFDFLQNIPQSSIMDNWTYISKTCALYFTSGVSF